MDPSAQRILDASANRAREACRTLEDIARFAVGDAGLVESLKRLRHELTAILRDLPGGVGAQLASRDAASDAGAAVPAPIETRRASLRDVALAAASRLTEALRSLEECAKTLEAQEPSPPGRGSEEGQQAHSASARIERLRFLAYDAAGAVSLALGAQRRRCAEWRLCAIITESLCARPWLDVARAAIGAGADCIQLREKALADRERLARARALVDLARPADVAVIINDRPDIALLARADGVHVGRSDLSVRDIRALVGDELIIGASASNIEEARAARLAGADYLGVGAMFPTTTKRKDAIAGPQLLRDGLEADPPLPPILAIGGIAPDNLASLVEAAAGKPFGVAVSAAVCAAADPAAVCEAILVGLRRQAAQAATALSSERTASSCP